MAVLNDTGEIILGIDLRIDPSLAMDLRQGWGDMASWSLWPEAPFGCSADTDVWPSAFARAEDQPGEDYIRVNANEAAYWRNMSLWRDMADLAFHTIPRPYATELVALGLHESPQERGRVAPTGLIAQLCKSTVSEEIGGMEAALLGYDITEELTTALFKSPRPESLEATQIARSEAGLIADRETAEAIRPELEAADPGAGALMIISVWSLGTRPAT